MIAVVGSNNVDLVLTVDHFTQPGETQKCLSYERFPGGKGANQAVACKKLTAEVYFLTCVGNDENGEFSFETLTRAGLRDGLVRVELPNGFAMIEVTRDGQNRIIIFPGANAAMNVKLVQDHLDELLKADILLLQNEIPFEVNLETARKFKEKGKLVIFDPAPAIGVTDEIYEYVDIITPNESEAHQLTGKFGESAARELLKKDVETFCSRWVTRVVISQESLERSGWMLSRSTLSTAPQRVMCSTQHLQFGLKRVEMFRDLWFSQQLRPQ